MAAKTYNKSATKGGSKRDKPPPLDQYIKPIIGIVLAVLGYHIFRGMIAKEILRVDLSSDGGTAVNELELREVLFGEDPSTGGNTNYAVLCYPENALYPISSVFQDSANDGTAPAQFRLLDCDIPMSFTEEKKTVMERFSKQLNSKTRPVVFVSGSIGSPKQVPAKFLKTGSMLTKALKNLLEPRSEKIETTQDLRSKCLDKDVCALLLKGSKVSPKYVKDAITKLVVEYPAVTFAAIDTSVLYVKGLEAEFLSELIPGMPRFIVFKKTSGTTDKSKTESSRLKTTAIALDVDVAYGPMSNLVASVISGSNSNDMTKVSTTPTIKTRTKKLEKEENAKRQRRKNREDGGSSSSSDSSGSGGGAFSSGGGGENDGSAEGRKAERDRRRAEHRKSNPNYKEKTPEEIKEMERQRRIRMEAEAEKWNMSPEDGEDDGDGSGGGNDYMDEENWDEDEYDLDNDEEDLDLDGEEVLDLD